MIFLKPEIERTSRGERYNIASVGDIIDEEGLVQIQTLKTFSAISDAAHAINNELSSTNIHEAEIKFGLKVSAKGKGYLSEPENAHYIVTLKWVKSDSEN